MVLPDLLASDHNDISSDWRTLAIYNLVQTLTGEVQYYYSEFTYSIYKVYLNTEMHSFWNK